MNMGLWDYTIEERRKESNPDRVLSCFIYMFLDETENTLTKEQVIEGFEKFKTFVKNVKKGEKKAGLEPVKLKVI